MKTGLARTPCIITEYPPGNFSVARWVLTESSAPILARREQKYIRAYENISQKNFVLFKSDAAFRTDIHDIAKSHLPC